MKYTDMMEISFAIFNDIMSETLEANIQIENVFSCDETVYTFYVSTCSGKPYEYSVYVSFNSQYDYITAHVISAPHVLGIGHAFFRYGIHGKFVINDDTGETVYKSCNSLE